MVRSINVMNGGVAYWHLKFGLLVTLSVVYIKYGKYV